MIGAQFFTTINFSIFVDTLKLLTYKLPYLRFWNEQEKLEIELKQYLNANDSKIYSFYNGRSALYHWLKWSNLQKWSKVIVSSYTCVSVVNAVLQAWFEPVYVDIDKNTLNISISDLKSKLNEDIKAIIVQHTFGNPADMINIMKIAEHYDLLVIEDCAHSLGAEIWWKKVGTFGDMAIFSTGRDKVISSVTWWFLFINNDEIDFKKPKLVAVSRKLALQNLMYNILAYLAWKTYDIKLWKVIMYLSSKLNLIPKILTSKEKSCNFMQFNYQLPNSLAYLVRKQLKRVEKINNHRIELAEIYKKEFQNIDFIQTIKTEKFAKDIYFWFPVIFSSKDKLDLVAKKMRQHNIYLGLYRTWDNIVPSWTDLESCKYTKWSCPTAEAITHKIAVFPNHFQVNKKQVERIIKLIK